ncbi:MAG: 30S ribosomal protein S21 [Planctomycetes bacterium]|nr:30S ribosomal protein S21 [Planctomycetota bacterium]
MIKVTIRSGESPDKLIQRFKRICSKEGVLKEIKKRSFYEKPSVKRRRRVKEMQKQLRKKLAKQSAKSK